MNSKEFKDYIQRKHATKESQLQAQCVAWFRMTYPAYQRLLFAIPNGARLYGNATQRAIQWRKLAQEGAVKGAADLLLAIPSGDYGGLFIEMKTTAKHSRQSEDQAQFEKDAVAHGFGYAMPRTVDEFMRVVINYLEKGEY